MAEHFTQSEWDTINDHLDQDPSAYGLPERRDGSIVLLSWNIRKFGAFQENGKLKKSSGAFDMIQKVCASADLVAIQEVLTDTASLYELRDRLRAGGSPWDVVVSDVTGMAPGYDGMAERHAFLYRSDRIERGDLASDLSFDRSAVVTNTNAALQVMVSKEVEKAGKEGFFKQVTEWLGGQSKLVGAKFKRFVQFIRTPHIVEFLVKGETGTYELYVVNAHLVSGKSKTERELEFFALLEWLLLDSRTTCVENGKTFVLMADLNLDFKADVDKRRAAFEEYMTSINSEKNLQAKVNFPFLDGDHFTNARGTETFDHIAWVTNDHRFPRGRHNPNAGTFGPDEYDYGMFNFVKAFADAGPGQASDGNPDFDKYVHDFTDHMPIWVRLPIPHSNQTDFSVSED
ncbi:hypothetical protein BXY66_2432 [Shimia isoporae]|uniref:Endonuclease/exonuclease/phosphatase family protein n=1 Tax=Shimia isoporae TaxID=647720 RepID=A0A4R1NBP7_9RHOB|nr:hypothetical protein [Shimia isoporae]TCL01123.1 hypothetical protein BXY66_2432 [Shimia isoporae]